MLFVNIISSSGGGGGGGGGGGCSGMLSELQHLNSTGISQKLKSQCGGIEVFVKHKVRWPHDYVLAGSNKECVMYDQLTMGQWMAGFCRDMNEESNQNSKDAMLDYLISIMGDSNDFFWSSAKASHAVLLCCMEQGEIKDFTETDKIDRVRRVHAQRHTSAIQDTINHALKHNNNRSMVCQYYNSRICSQQNSHEAKGVMYRHVCYFCFTKSGKSFQHTEANCKNKLKAKKLVGLGVGSTLACYVSSRRVWSTIKNSKYTKKELLADKHTALSCFRSFKPFDHRHDGRTYAKVLSAHSKPQTPPYPLNDNQSTSILAIP